MCLGRLHAVHMMVLSTIVRQSHCECTVARILIPDRGTTIVASVLARSAESAQGNGLGNTGDSFGGTGDRYREKPLY